MEDLRTSPDMLRFPAEGNAWFMASALPLCQFPSFRHLKPAGKGTTKGAASNPSSGVHKKKRKAFELTNFMEGSVQASHQADNRSGVFRSGSSSGEDASPAQALLTAHSPVQERTSSGPGTAPVPSANENGGIRVVGPDEDCGVEGCRVRSAHLEHLHCVLPRCVIVHSTHFIVQSVIVYAMKTNNTL